MLDLEGSTDDPLFDPELGVRWALDCLAIETRLRTVLSERTATRGHADASGLSTLNRGKNRPFSSS